MVKKSVQDFVENFKLARKFVELFNLEYSAFFEKPISLESIKKICASIDINLKKSPFNKEVPGRLESRLENNKEITTLFYSTKLDVIPKHNAIFHEIGHWVLLNSKIDLSNKSLRWKELFANNFSNLICIPFNYRFEVVESLFEMDDVSEVIRLVNKHKVRLHISTLLKTLSFEIRNDEKYLALTNPNTLWIAVKLTQKKAEVLEPKFRIISALYDFEKYYLPEQLRVEQIINDIDQKLSMAIGEKIDFDSEIKLSSVNSADDSRKKELFNITKYSKKTFPCRIQILRLKRSNTDNLSTYLFLVKLKRT